MRVLGIETSCDETGVAIYDSDEGLLADALHSQIAVHAEYGGVVPELASRDHVRKLLPMIRQVLAEANCTQQDITGIAYTAGPRAGRCLNGGWSGGQLAGLRVGYPRSGCASYGRPFAGAHARR